MEEEFESHAVCRSSELLACARTALKLAQAAREKDKNEDDLSWLANVHVNQLSLWRQGPDEEEELSRPQRGISECVQLLSVMESLKEQVEALVRRRGHTNDPTQEISNCMQQFQSCTRELLAEAATVPKLAATSRSRGQAQQHYEKVSLDLQARAKSVSESFQKALERRSEVLKEQSERRRKLLTTSGNSNTNTNTTTPLNNPSSTSTSATSFYSASQLPTTSRAYSTYQQANSYNSNNNGVAANTGMRHRKGVAATTHNNNNTNSSLYPPYYSSSAYAAAYGAYNSSTTTASTATASTTTTLTSTEQPESMTELKLQQRQQRRDVRVSLDNARQAEQAIASLQGMFSKMATLIHSQSEIMDKIETDVEAAESYTTQAHDELVKLNEITKGNRGLIIKTFAILIVMILFLRLY